MNSSRGRHGPWSWWYLLFVVQIILVLWPPLYNRAEPALMGIPFFYWCQLMFVIIGAVINAFVYFVTEN